MLDSFLFAVNSVMPIILMVLIGYVLKRMGFISLDFVKMGNKLVFRVFLPVMLFLNVYKIEDIAAIDFGYVVYALVATLCVFAIGIVIVLVTTTGNKRGALLQCIFRSNYALIGIPLAASLFPGDGESVATLLSAALVPLFNVLAVIALSIFRKDGGKVSVKGIILGILKNPLILGIALGLVSLGIRAIFVECSIPFRLSEVGAIYKTLGYLSNLATPLALILLGAQFEFSAIASLKREIITGVAMRNVFVPLLTLGVAYIFFGSSFTGAQFAALVAAFSTPVAVSSVPMAQEMGSDASLAGQLVVFTTISSAVSIFLASFVFSLLGIFG